ncbi:MAG: aminotransferase class IV [Peptococcaceae bacterium]|nr:aminotransferase class IV [Peptococcaceae bacterium]
MIYLNGRLQSAAEGHVAIANRSFLLGDGLFETMLVRGGRPRFLAEHLARLLASARYFGYHMPTRPELEDAINCVITANSLQLGSLRLTVSPCTSQGLLAAPDSPLDILITVKHGLSYEEGLYERGFKAIIAHSTRRNEHSPLSRHKTTSFLDNVLAKKEAHAAGADEALLLNSKGDIAEGAVSNLFIVAQGEVRTPRIEDGALPGIMRGQVMALCHRLNIPFSEAKLAPADLFRADEAFLTNALLGIMPVARVGEQAFASGDKGSLCRRLEDLLGL